MKHISIYVQLALTYVFFLIVAIFYRGPGLDGNIDKILSLATFLFAIDLGFSTANRKARLDSIRSLLRKNDAWILSVYESTKSMDKKITDKTREMLDTMLITQIDYNILDFEKSLPALLKLIEYANNIPANKKEEYNKNLIISCCDNMLLSQKEIAYWIKDKMMPFEWISLITFGLIMVWCIYALSDGTTLAIAVLPLIATAITLLMYVIRDINNLSWQEENWIWNRLIDLFQELDLPPYMVGVIMRNGRLNVKKLELPKEYRVVEYPHPYPNFDGKQVTLVKNPNYSKKYGFKADGTF